jgi:hypothetical protein
MAHTHENGQAHGKVTTLDLLKRYLSLKIEKMSGTKKSAINPNISPLDQMAGIDINHIAIVIDGEVQDVIRAQNKMAAMVLSNPEFVFFEPKETKVKVGFKYKDGKFIEPEEVK